MSMTLGVAFHERGTSSRSDDTRLMMLNLRLFRVTGEEGYHGMPEVDYSPSLETLPAIPC